MMGVVRVVGRSRKRRCIPRLTGLEDRTLLTTLVVNPAGGPGVFTTIQAAINFASSAGSDTIEIAPGTYTEQLTIDKSLTMMGTGPGVTVKAPNPLTPDPTFHLRSLVLVTNAATASISNLTITGPAPDINDGILIVEGATAHVTDTTVTQIQDPAKFGVQTGFGIQIGGTGAQAVGQVGNATISHCTVTAYQKAGIIVGRSGSTGTITDSTVTGVGPTTQTAQNGIQIGPGSASATVSNTTISGNHLTGTGSGPDPGPNNDQSTAIIDYIASSSITGNTITDNDDGLEIADSASTGTGAMITGNTLQGNLFENIVIRQGTSTVTANTITGSNIGVLVIASATDSFGNPVTTNAVGTLVSNDITNNGNGTVAFPGGGIRLLVQPGATTTAIVTANFNRIVGNKVGLDNTTNNATDATLNWWGSNTGPNTTGNDSTTGTVNVSPWLVLGISTDPNPIGPGGSTVVTADLTTDSGGTTHSAAPFFPDNIPIAFGATGGTIDPASAPTSSGKATSHFTSTGTSGDAASATLDNQTVSSPITVTPIVFPPPTPPPQVIAGAPFSLTYDATGGAGGFTYAVLTRSSQLPPGLSLDSTTGILSGTPTTPGTYNFTVTATDASGASKSVNTTLVIESSSQVVAPTVQNLQRFGFHAQPTTFVLTFSTALDAATAQDLANYHLNRLRGQTIGGAIPITGAIYDPTTHTVTLQPSHRVYLFGRYLLVVNGSTPTGVAGATGLLLDGKGNGMPGSDYVATFGKEILAGPNAQVARAKRSLRHELHPGTASGGTSLTASSCADRSHGLSEPTGIARVRR
jgi:hypothetical protein